MRGYQGVMDLDMTDMPAQFHAQAVERHIKDIAEYKHDQMMRKPNERYENTVLRAARIHANDRSADNKRNAARLAAQARNDAIEYEARMRFIALHKER